MTIQEKPECNLSNADGNVYYIIGAVRKALKRAGQTAKVEEFTTKAKNSTSYDAVLQLCFEYVEVT